MKNIVFPFAFIGVTLVMFFTKPDEAYCINISIGSAEEIVSTVVESTDGQLQDAVRAKTINGGIIVKDRLLFRTIYLRVKGQYVRLGVAGIGRVFLFK